MFGECLKKRARLVEGNLLTDALAKNSEHMGRLKKLGRMS